MIFKIRTHPIVIYFCTRQDAKRVHKASQGLGSGPCFCTENFGEDGFAWSTCEEFENDYTESFGSSWKGE